MWVGEGSFKVADEASATTREARVLPGTFRCQRQRYSVLVRDGGGPIRAEV